MGKDRVDFYRESNKVIDYNEIKNILFKYKQHKETSVWEHSRNVAYRCYIIAKHIEKRYGIKFNYKELLVGSYLHDFFLYDWHKKEKWHKWHGFKHPMIASKNAEKIFNINDKEKLIIESHMWPLNIKRLPKSKEAILVCLVDKFSAILEIIK